MTGPQDMPQPTHVMFGSSPKEEIGLSTPQQLVPPEQPVGFPYAQMMQLPPQILQQMQQMQLMQSMQPYAGGMVLNPFSMQMNPAAAGTAPGIALPDMSQFMAPAMYPTLLQARGSVGGALNVPGPSTGSKPSAETQHIRKGRAGGRDHPVQRSKDDSCSAVVREVRRSGAAQCKLSLPEIIAHAGELARDREGSKLLQMCLDSAGPMERNALWEALVPEVVRLSNDASGSQVVMELLEVGNGDQRRAVANQLRGEVLKLSNRMYGCRVIQKVIETTPPELQVQVTRELESGILDCMKSMHGNYVVQKCIEQMPPDSVIFIAEALKERVECMATHIYGCRVIQRLLEHIPLARLEGILERILRSTLRLAQDQYGNYVVRHILEHGRVEHKRHIIDVVQCAIVELGRDKCGSTVAEKCIDAASAGEHAHLLQEQRQALLYTLIGTGEGAAPCQQLVDDRFGKYVVQRALQACSAQEREVLRERLAAISSALRCGGAFGDSAMLGYGRR